MAAQPITNNSLADKVPVGNIDLSTLLKEAEGAVLKMEKDFNKEVLTLIESLKESISSWQGGDDAALKDVRGSMHELRGVSGTFGYQMSSDVADNCVRMIDAQLPRDVTQKLLEVHFVTLNLVFREVIKGDGGQKGQEVVASLRQALIVSSGKG